MQWEVTYELANPNRNSSSSGFISRTDLSNLKTVVEATSSNQAKQIVESMYGGSMNCRAVYAWPMR
jgi:hypothetical protein